MAAGFSLAQFEAEGYTGPIQVFSEAEAAQLRSHFWAKLGQSEDAAGPSKINMSAWHHQHRWVYDLVTHPGILDPIASILGPNVIMWAVHFWYKEPNNGKYLPWHQDGAYWPIEPKKNVSAWIALGPTFAANGCLKVIPGSHKVELLHGEMNDKASGFGKGLRPEEIDESQAVSLEMQPGQIVIFNEKTIHGSGPNVSTTPRVALSVRFTTPEVKFLLDQWTGVDRIKTYVVRGEDTHHLNDSIRGPIPAA